MTARKARAKAKTNADSLRTGGSRFPRRLGMTARKARAKAKTNADSLRTGGSRFLAGSE
jgi:hypothetical protein